MSHARHKSAVLVVLLMMLVMYQVDATIVNVATPAIRGDLGASGAAIELVISGYLLASATLLITGARLGQMRGYRSVFLAGLGVFGTASLACGLAPDPTVLIGARVCQGVGGALAFPQVLTGIQVTFAEGAERTRALGLYSIALAGGAVLGQILGGLLVSANVLGLGWRPIFLINVPITCVAILAGRRFLPRLRPADSGAGLDLYGASTLAGAVLLIVLPLSLGGDAGWPVWTWICLGASVPLVATFIALERRRPARGRSPLVNLHVIRRPRIAWGLLSQALAVATYYALLFTLAQYLQGGLGDTALVSGITLLPWVVAFGVPGRLLDRLSAHAPALPPVGCVILAAAYAGISASMLAGQRSETVLLGLLALGGLGLGTNFSAILVHLTSSATPRYAADISGVFTTVVQIAGAIGVAAFGTLYMSQMSQITVPTADTAVHAFGVVTAAFALVALVAAATAYRATHPATAHANATVTARA